MKVVINSCYGGFGLSKTAKDLYSEISGNEVVFDEFVISRADPVLVQVVEELGEFADGDFAELKIVEIPDGVDWFIQEYDGVEWIAERHRIWD